MQKKYVKILYSSPIGILSLVADDHYLYGIWVQEQKHFERGLGDETIEEVVSHPILDPVIACLDDYFKGKPQDLSNLLLAPIGTKSSCVGSRQASDRLCCRSGKESLALGA